MIAVAAVRIGYRESRCADQGANFGSSTVCQRPVSGRLLLKSRLWELCSSIPGEEHRSTAMLFERRGLRIVIAAIMAPLATACATQSLTPTLEIPKLPSALAGEPGRFDGRSADIYGLIASGALTCWFAANGQLKKSHIFHADADPQAKGGAVEIAVLERDLVGPKPWGPKAFKVALSQSGDQTTIEVDNLKLPEDDSSANARRCFSLGAGRQGLPAEADRSGCAASAGCTEEKSKSQGREENHHNRAMKPQVHVPGCGVIRNCIRVLTSRR